MHDREVYDVCVVGSGPAGSTCAFFLSLAGRRVLLLEARKFPRDKICGDAVCSRAFPFLRDMGVLQSVLEEDQGNFTENGGFVSPSGIRYVGNSADHNRAQLVVAVKRIVLDEKMARAAARAGAVLVDGCPVERAEFDARSGTWAVRCRTEDRRVYRAAVLVAADGAHSRLARSLGYLDTPPEAVCSRSYIEADTHNFDLDGMVFYPRELLPGYAALHREAGGDVNYCCFIIPGGQCTVADLKRMHHKLLAGYPEIRDAVGPDARMERMKAAPLRMGGVRRSYGDRFLMVGDAAGHIDPLTGEGIHYAIEGGFLAAETLNESFSKGDLSARSLSRYQWKWMNAFGLDFFFAGQMASVLAAAPLFLDAFAELSNQRGMEFMIRWAGIMTGLKPKSHFFRPSLSLPLMLQAARRLLRW